MRLFHPARLLRNFDSLARILLFVLTLPLGSLFLWHPLAVLRSELLTTSGATEPGRTRRDVLPPSDAGLLPHDRPELPAAPASTIQRRPNGSQVADDSANAGSGAIRLADTLQLAPALRRPYILKYDSLRCIDSIIHYARLAAAGRGKPQVTALRERLQCSSIPAEAFDSIYNAAFDSAHVPSVWSHIIKGLAYLGGSVVVGTILKLLSPFLAPQLKLLGQAIYNRLAGTQPLCWLSRRRYLNSVRNKYARLKIPYGRDREFDLGNIYVPLRTTASDATDDIDIHSVLLKRRRIMVTGAPGSGKSILLRHLAFCMTRAATQSPLTGCIPVLVELHRVDRLAFSLRSEIQRVFLSRGFPKAGSFILRHLKTGKLLLLFDGLDEVSPDARGNVVKQINDLMDQYRQLRTVITCRSTVYQGEFRERVDCSLEVAPFSDKEIYRYVINWKNQLPAE
jgi:hypothetical protein